MGGTRRGVELREREREGDREKKSERVQAYRRYFHRLHTARSIGDGTGNVVAENLHCSRWRRNAGSVLFIQNDVCKQHTASISSPDALSVIPWQVYILFSLSQPAFGKRMDRWSLLLFKNNPVPKRGLKRPYLTCDSQRMVFTFQKVGLGIGIICSVSKLKQTLGGQSNVYLRPQQGMQLGFDSCSRLCYFESKIFSRVFIYYMR